MIDKNTTDEEIAASIPTQKVTMTLQIEHAIIAKHMMQDLFEKLGASDEDKTVQKQMFSILLDSVEEAIRKAKP